MEWISVKDRLPDEGVQVLTVDTTNPKYPEYRLDYIVVFDLPDQPYIWARRLEEEMDKVSHWMLLPEVPKDV
jgi:hypothetical protein